MIYGHFSLILALARDNALLHESYLFVDIDAEIYNFLPKATIIFTTNSFY